MATPTETKPASPSSAKPEKKLVGRSPDYPSIALPLALEKVKLLYEGARRNQVHFSKAMEFMGYTMKSSGGRLAFSALKKFGLIDISGAGAKRAAKVSDAAYQILIDDRPGSSERQAAIQRLALRPKAHARIWETYGGALPADAELLFQLKAKFEFTEAGAKDFLEEFKKTLEFAKVDSSTTIQPGQADDDDDDDADEGNDHPMLNATQEKPKAPAPFMPPAEKPALVPNGPQIRLPLLENNELFISLRSRVSESEFATITAILTSMKPLLVRVEADTTKTTNE
jgi:hypothetical protein